jgi:two-component system response regulator HydG
MCEACRGEPPGALLRCTRMIAESAAMRAVLQRAAPMASSDAPVVVLGETGTGKEVLARAMHASGPRAARPFVALSCAAMPADLLESELFGHVRGAVSGAIGDKTGLFQAADGGTLLLDEIAELPLGVQAKLLRVLQDRQIRRVGGSQPVAVNVRVMAASHQPLRQLVEGGTFREDLYYRLRVFQVVLPPLRERPEDILPLARDVLQGLTGGAQAFGPEAEHALAAHRWPGNVRELVNAVRHGAALARGAVVERADLPEDVTGPAAAAPAGARPAPRTVLRSLAAVEREHILAVLKACRGNHSEAARVLEIGRNTLWRKLELYREEDEGGERSA